MSKKKQTKRPPKISNSDKKFRISFYIALVIYYILSKHILDNLISKVLSIIIRICEHSNFEHLYIILLIDLFLFILKSRLLSILYNSEKKKLHIIINEYLCSLLYKLIMLMMYYTYLRNMCYYDIISA